MPYKNIEDRRASNRRTYHRLRQKLIDLKGGECKDCGRTDRSFDIDHVEEDGKNARRRKSRYKEYRRLLDNPHEYEIRCVSPCHSSKTMRYVRSYGRGGKRAKVLR